MKRQLNQKAKQEIFEAYVRGMNVRDIAEMYDMSPSYVSRIAKKMGAPARRPNIKVEQTAKNLYLVQKVIEVSGAKFCCFCGTDIRSPRELLITRLESAMPKLKYLPESDKDEMHKLFVDLRNELHKEAVR